MRQKLAKWLLSLSLRLGQKKPVFLFQIPTDIGLTSWGATTSVFIIASSPEEAGLLYIARVKKHFYGSFDAPVGMRSYPWVLEDAKHAKLVDTLDLSQVFNA